MGWILDLKNNFNNLKFIVKKCVKFGYVKYKTVVAYEWLLRLTTFSHT